MTISTVLEVAVGLVLVYYVLGLIVSYITSEITKWTELRAQRLAEGLQELLKDSAMFDDFMNHPLIKNLQPEKYKLLSREKISRRVEKIPSATFVNTFFDVLVRSDFVQSIQGAIETIDDLELQERLRGLIDERKLDDIAEAIAKIDNRRLRERLQALIGPGDYLQQVKRAIGKIDEGELRNALQGLINQSVDDLKEAQQKVEQWFNDAMVNVSSLYEQNARRIVIVLALVVTVATNADSVAIGRRLWEQPTLRAAAAAKADEFIQQAPDPDAARIEDYVTTLEELSIPIFWTQPLSREPGALILKVVGLAITWLATAQGSSFWYDVLKKIRTPTEPAAPKEAS